MKRIVSYFLLLMSVLLMSSCAAFLQGLAAGSMMAMGGYGAGYNPYGYNPYQTYSPLVTPTSTSTASKEIKVTDRELQVEEDGYRWYETSGKGGVNGAEDIDHNTLIPLSRGYTLLYYMAVDGHQGYFAVKKDGKAGICDLTGKEIIPPNYKQVFFSGDSFKYSSSSGEYVSMDWSLDSKGKGVKVNNNTISTSASNSTNYNMVSGPFTTLPVISPTPVPSAMTTFPVSQTPVSSGTTTSTSASAIETTSSYEAPKFGYVYVDCPSCHTTGNCQNCHGSGTYYGFTSDPMLCPNCNHTGKCSMCNGTGKVQRYERLN